MKPEVAVTTPPTFPLVMSEEPDMNLYILVGVPGSGKSTYAKEHLSHTTICSSDKFIEAFAEASGLTYTEIFRESIDLADSLFRWELGLAARQHSPITIDRTNLTKKSRKEWFEFKEDGYKIHAVVFPTPREGSVGWIELQRRLKSREGKHIPENVMRSVISRFEMPDFEEGFSSIQIVNNLRVGV